MNNKSMENKKEKKEKLPINFDEESWHANLFLYWNNFGTKLPINACPYVWKNIVYFLLMIPLLLYSIPAIIINIIDSWFTTHSYGRDSVFDKYLESKAHMLFSYQTGIYALLLMLSLFLIIQIPFVQYFILDMPMELGGVKAALCGLLINAVILFFLVAYLVKLGIKKYRNRNTETKENGPTGFGQLLILTAKSKFDKICPMIVWNKKN